MEALSADREALWARVAAADFLTVNEKRAAVGYGDVEGGEALGPLAAKYNFDPTQPRVPAGNSDGGRWTRTGAGSAGEFGPRESRDQADGSAKPFELAADVGGFTKHGINQVIQRGISPIDILEAINNPIQVLLQPNGTTRYVGGGAVVVLNEARVVVTVWGR